MIQCIDQIEISVNQRLDHMATLLLDSQQLALLLKDDDHRKSIVRNFRLIKSAEKDRIANQQRYLKQMQRVNHSLHKNEVMQVQCFITRPLTSASESMLANCINQYLNADYETRKSGDPNDLIEVFLFYYSQINAQTKVRQLTVIKNCQLFQEVHFLQQNLAFLLMNMQASLRFVYERQKNKFLNVSKEEGRSLSPERKQQEQKFDSTGREANKSKRKLQQYCFEMSKVLGLQGLYINYFYFNSMDSEKRKRTLTSNFLKRNLHIQRLINNYQNQYRLFVEKQKK